MKVSEWMHRNVTTVGPDASVTEIARVMVDRRTGCVPVVDETGLLGIVTEQDLVAKHAKLHFPTYVGLLGFVLPLEGRRDEREIEKALAAKASELMSTDIVAVAPDADIDEAATLMVDHSVGCIPVVEHGRLVGLVGRSDVVRLLVVEGSV